MSQIVFLEGEKIHLRPLELEDLTMEYVQWLNDAEVCRFNSHAVFPYTLEKMKEYFNYLQQTAQQNIVLAIIDKHTLKHIGNISLQNINWINRDAEFAILLGNKEYWNRGVATEGALLICDYGFKRLNLNRIYCGTSSLNIGMQRLAEKLKMQQEGIRRQAMFKEGGYVDVIEYGVLNEEFYQS